MRTLLITAGLILGRLTRALSPRASLSGAGVRPTLINLGLLLRAALSARAWACLRAGFDVNFYRAQYPDVASAGIPPFIHYLLQGYLERRAPSARFAPVFYEACYDDVRKKGLNPLLHYCLFGCREGRFGAPAIEGAPGAVLGPAAQEPNLDTTVWIDNEWPSDLPLVSVVIPCYNYGRYLREAVDSALRQTFKDLEIIVVEGGSSDPDSIGAARELARDAPANVRVLFRSERYLAGDNRNFGIGAARGRYICCLDADDQIDPVYIEVAVFLAETYGYDLVYPSMRSFGGSEAVWEVPEPSFPVIAAANQVSTVALFRRSAWAHVGGFRDWPPSEPYVPEDWDFWVRLLGHGYRATRIRKPLMRYRVHSQSLSAGSRMGSSHATERIIEANARLVAQPSAAPRQVRVISPSVNLRRHPEGDGRPCVLFAMPFVIVGGAEAQMAMVASGLRDAGYSITVTTTVRLRDGFRTYFEQFEPLTTWIYDLPSLFENPLLWREFYWHLIETKNIQAVVVAGSEFVYHLLPDMHARYPHIKIFDQLFNDAGHVHNNRRYSEHIVRTIVPSPELRDSLAGNHSADLAKITVIRAGVDVSGSPEGEIPSGTPDWTDKFLVSFIGRLSPEKAPLHFVEIANRLRAHRDMAFCMVGDGPERAAVLDRIARYRLNERVWAPGIVPDVRPFMRRSGVVVLPSVLDGMPLVVLEAQMLGTPVVASRVGSVPGTILQGETGFLCDSGDVDGFCEAILMLYQNRPRRDQMGARAREWANEMFSPAAMKTAYCGLIDAFVRGGATGAAAAGRK